MKQFKNGTYEGERALFKTEDAIIDGCTFQNGESPLKESRNLKLSNVTFKYKYPLWYCNNVEVNDTHFIEQSKSGIWYTNRATFNNCVIEVTKEFRRCNGITITNTTFLDAKETLWKCKNIKMDNVKAKGDYFLMNSENIQINNLHLDGNYFVDGSTNIIIRNSYLNSKDAFWNCTNVTVYDSTIIGEYFGWNSTNVTLINCHIESLQGFCYMQNLKLVNCTLKDTSLAFEYSTVEADINSTIDSVKNPISGTISCLGIDELITDDCDISKTKIIIKNK